jgi:hypothetical protein
MSVATNPIIEDRRSNPVNGRTTAFRIQQTNAIAETYSDLNTTFCDSYDSLLACLRDTITSEGSRLFGQSFRVEKSAIGKVEGDAYELLTAAHLWNHMSEGPFIPLKLPRGFDFTQLLRDEHRQELQDENARLRTAGLDPLALSTPDIVGVNRFGSAPSSKIDNLSLRSQLEIEGAYRAYLGRLSPDDVRFAVAIKRSIRSDRLYQPIYEAEAMKFLLGMLGSCGQLDFIVQLGSYDGANVVKHFGAPSMVSLARGIREKAVDHVYCPRSPQETCAELDSRLYHM